MTHVRVHQVWLLDWCFATVADVCYLSLTRPPGFRCRLEGQPARLLFHLQVGWLAEGVCGHVVNRCNYTESEGYSCESCALPSTLASLECAPDHLGFRYRGDSHLTHLQDVATVPALVPTRARLGDCPLCVTSAGAFSTGCFKDLCACARSLLRGALLAGCWPEAPRSLLLRFLACPPYLRRPLHGKHCAA